MMGLSPTAGRAVSWAIVLILLGLSLALIPMRGFPLWVKLSILAIALGALVWRIGWRRLPAAIAILYVIFVFGWVPYFLGGLATRQRFRYQDKENEGLTPATFHLPFEDVSFRAEDSVPLKGWWVPARENRGSVILVHGLNRSRIEMVKKVPFLAGLGWNSLLFDLRHHGESGGNATTFGYREREDVKAAIALAREKCPGPVVLWGVSLGAASVMLEAAEDPSIAGIICDSSYLSLRDTVRHHLVLFRSFAWWLRVVPAWPVADETIFWIGNRAGFPPDDVDVKAAASRVAGRPILFVACSNDRRMPKEIAFELQAAAGPKAQVLVVPGESHGGAYRFGTEAYQHAVTQVLEQLEGGAQTARADLP